ncbi:E3 ubiquitin-protein ligase SHPRH [Anopheles maculipalpis]|uniref:E3 ubiquitin-protein ligase SHPRH n=1 Tax=Anopheles maculipalpis TaxID=1496333 RepID=UPI0021590466|nr:E3 ubiquitin-protein ligase SHPRH [Anopheles maculipalpis]
MEYCVLDIGVRRTTPLNENIPSIIPPSTSSSEASTSTNPPPIRQFKHERQLYTQLDPELNINPIIRDVRRVPEYELRERTDASDPTTVVLGIFLRILDPSETIDYGCTKQRQRLISQLFEEVERRSFVEEELEKISSPALPDSDGKALSVQQFYDQLRVYHQARSAKNESCMGSDSVQHPYLRPLLRTYQQQAIRWMLHRETGQETLPAQYVRLRNRAIPEVEFFMDLYHCTLSDQEPKPTPLPAGGILADEMGMGKTVEILGLILQNRKHATITVTKRPPDYADDYDGEGDSAELRCLCIKTHRKKTIACSKCGRLQHRKCVLKHHQPDRKKSTFRYICPECWRTEPLVESGATIIVSPASIKHQWENEIRKHVCDPSFRVFVYNGVTDTQGKWISPADLASYDVVLTDYNVLKPEIYLVAENARTSRHEKRFLVPATPLTMIRWWRVCLDEAQMVEGLNNNATKMVKALPAEHRWTVTGTPIEKTINNLHGLVHYLDYEPYSYFPVWSQYASRFQAGNAEPLLQMMVRVMWRTCKHAVLDQLGIPPQTERIHYIRMSDLQSYFYRGEHYQCTQAFREKARKIGLSLRLAEMNIQTMNVLLEPLRKLRLDCTIPSVLHVGTATLQAKKLLTPAELHEHLVSTNANDCKGQLRSVVSSLNGMAAVHILQQSYDQALRLYQTNLRLADDYKGTISVDTLLQIHAIHNLLDLISSHGEELDATLKPTPEQIQAYEERCARLEWGYIEQYASKVRSIENALLPAIKKVNYLIANNNGHRLVRLDRPWWFDLLAFMETNAHLCVTFQYRLFREQNLLENTGVSSWRSMGIWLLNWMEKIVARRQALQRGFQSLAFFVDNLRPNHLWPAVTRTSIEQLIRTAFACHLDPALFQEDENGMRTEKQLAPKGKSAAPLCLLCKVKDTLNQLEAVLFLDKQTQVATGGLWQVSPQEQVLKQLHQYAKRQENMEQTIVTEGEHFLSFLERIKVEFKEYSQYWVEINYTVAAYDELTMCKSRLQLLTEAEHREMQLAKKKPSPLQLLACELSLKFNEMQLTKATAEREFVRIKGTLKYLEHLGARKEIDLCPICHIVPEEKYAVFQCGHLLCSACSLNMFKFARASGNASCAVCRHVQLVKDIQYVTLTANTKIQTVRGSYSNKIIKIVETVLELIEEERDVKIVIFSHWELILSELGVALEENDIKYRQKSRKFYQSLEEFKDYANGITCLLLPLRSGSKGLNLTEATHVFLVEPILNPGEEMQAIGRVHRIGQTRPTFVHRFIMLETIEATIHETIQGDRSGRWLSKEVTVEQLEQLFRLNDTDM